MDRSVLREVHRYWFGEAPSATEPPPKERQDMWFRPTEAIDSHIRDTFGRHLDPANAANWDVASLSPVEQVGLIVLLDQFPRHIWRKSGEAFAYDSKVLSISRDLAASGWRRFPVAEQAFVLLPFEHSEAVADQDLSVRFFAERAVEAPDAFREGCRAGLDFATKHRDIIRKFGRFPHRNEVLGRQSTPEELEFLKGGRGF